MLCYRRRGYYKISISMLSREDQLRCVGAEKGSSHLKMFIGLIKYIDSTIIINPFMDLSMEK